MARITNGEKTGTVPDDKAQEYLANGWTLVKVDEVMITDGKKRGRIPREQLKDYEANGWRLVVSGSGEAEPFASNPVDDEEQRRWDGEDAEGGPGKSTFSETAFDLGNGLMKGMTFGFDDVVAGLGARAGDFTQKMLDNDDGFAANWRRSGDAYDEGVKERRAEVQASKDRSPTATSIGEIGGVLATVPLQAVRGASTVGKVARGARSGALAALGFGDSDTLKDAAVDAAGGLVLGGALAGLAPLVPGVVGKVATKVVDKAKGPKAQELAAAVVDAAEANPLARSLVASVTGGKSEAAVGLAKLARTKPAVVPAAPAQALPEWMQTGAGYLDDVADDPLAVMTPAERALELEARKKALEALAGL